MRFIKYNSFKRPIRLSLYLYLGSRKMHQEIQPKVQLEKNGRDFKIVFITDVASEPQSQSPGSDCEELTTFTSVSENTPSWVM